MRAAFVLLLAGCSSLSSVRLPPSDPCSLENPERAAFVADCDAKIAKCPRDKQGRAVESCAALVECERAQAAVCG
jgi:hypothetical protein